MKTICVLVLAILVAATSFAQKEEKVKMPIVDTGQTVTFARFADRIDKIVANILNGFFHDPPPITIFNTFSTD